MSATVPKLDIEAVRSNAYAAGRSLVDSVTGNEYRADQRQAALKRRYPVASTGLRFEHELYTGQTETWAIYAYPVPLLAKGEVWGRESVMLLNQRLRNWDTPVLIRMFETSGTSRTSVHRDNAELRDRFPELDDVVFRARTMGYGQRRNYVQMAYVEMADQEVPADA